MRSLLIITMLFAFSHNAVGQSGKQTKLQKASGDANCTYKLKYSAIQRNKIYPFNIAHTIKLVSFRYHKNNYPVNTDTLLLDSLVEIKTLTKTQIDKLSDVLFNNFYRKPPSVSNVTQCFSPRNAILFFDKFGHLREFILICFHCDNYELSSDKIDIGDECDQKIEKLRMLFVSVGLSFGTDKTIDFYSGEDDDEGIIIPSKNN